MLQQTPQTFALKTAMAPHFPVKHTTSPIVTGTSVLAIKYCDGVMMMADTLGSYGRMSRFRNMQRLKKVGESTLLGASGDISDFQAVQEMIERMRVRDFCIDDGAQVDSKEIFSYLSRVTYNRRNKFDLLWNSFVVAGFTKGKILLGVVDKLGNAYEEKYIATGYGAHLALPLMREKHVDNMSEADARKLMEMCMKVLYYRDCRTINKIQRATVTKAGIQVSEPYVLDTEWEFKTFVNAKAGGDTGGSW